MSVFRSPVEAVVFWGTLGFAGGAAVAWFVRHPRPRGPSRRDFMPLLFVLIAADLAIGYARTAPLPHWLFYPGEALFVTGASFTGWSYKHLGAYLSLFAEVLPDHRLVEDGPYRLIRHPGYVGAMVALVGLGLALQSWVTLLATPVISAAILGQRIHAEEELMTVELGDPYLRYMARTKRFIPFVW